MSYLRVKLRPEGKKGQRTYAIVIANLKSYRKGRFQTKLGTYFSGKNRFFCSEINSENINVTNNQGICKIYKDIFSYQSLSCLKFNRSSRKILRRFHVLKSLEQNYVNKYYESLYKEFSKHEFFKIKG